MYKKLCLALFCYCIIPTSFAQDDDWFDLGRHRFGLNVHFGSYSEGGVLQRLGLRAPLPGNSEINLAYSRVSDAGDIVVGDSRYPSDQSATRAHLSSDPYARWVVSAGYEAGQTEFTESYRQGVLGLGYNANRGYIEASFIAGNDELELPLPRRYREPTILHYQRDRLGLGIMASYFQHIWIVSAHYRDYTLSSDELSRSDDAFERDPSWQEARDNYIQQRRRLRRAGVSYSITTTTAGSGFQQVGSIAERTWQLSLAATVQQWLLGVGYAGYEGYTSGGAINSYYSSAALPLGNHIDIQLLASMLEDSDALYGELGAILHW